MRIGLWYPSEAKEIATRLGPFDVEIAQDAPVANGYFQPILMSHGNSGRFRNHHLTAKALANAGFIVVAPDHTVDHLIGGSEVYQAINWRITELSHALEAILQIEAFRNVIDLSQIHGLGYSLGTLTVMAAAGAGIDGPAADKHCLKNKDPNFCDTPSLFLRWKLKWLRDVSPPDLVRKIPNVYFSLPIINGDVVLVAPLGQGLKINENLFQARKVLVLGFENDKINVPKYHANKVAEIIPRNVLYNFIMHPMAHHSAFIAPFAKRVTDKEYISAAQDPPGFDRSTFLDVLNSEIVDFLLRKPN